MKDYQALTNKILREATFGASSAADYGDPIRATEMQGHFFHRLKSSRFKYFRLLFALSFFILPAIAGFALPLLIRVQDNLASLIGYGVIFVLCVLSLLVGIKIISR
jgi:hypothetical protein